MRSTLAVVLLIAAVVGSSLGAPAACLALPRLPDTVPTRTVVSVTESVTEPTSTPDTSAGLDAAVSAALEAEERVAAARDDLAALEQRIDVANERVFAQITESARAEEALAEAQARYATRLVALYKSGTENPLLLLLAASSADEFAGRAQLLWSLVSRDRDILRAARRAADSAAFEHARLDALKAELVSLRTIKVQRAKDLVDDLKEREGLVARLNARERALVDADQRDRTESHARWRQQSIPLGEPIELRDVTVDPHREPFRAPAHVPTRYRVISDAYSAVCSWYGDEFHGRPTASGQVFNADDFTCASRSLPFGTKLALERDGRRVVVVVTDRGPFVSGRDLDLSQAAAEALGVTGVDRVTAEFVESYR